MSTERLGTPAEAASAAGDGPGGHWCTVADGVAARLATAEDQLTTARAGFGRIITGLQAELLAVNTRFEGTTEAAQAYVQGLCRAIEVAEAERSAGAL